MNKKHTLWIERYRSKTLEQYVGSDDLKVKIQQWIDQNDVPHLILGGSAGTGKTTLAKLLYNTLNCSHIYLNASDENGIDMIREKVKGFAQAASIQPIKIVVLDEADFLTGPAQAALRNLIEEYSNLTRFILTCNFLEKLIEPLTSRCEVYKIVPPSMSAVANHIVNNILIPEDVSYDIKEVAALIKEHYPDVRSIIKYAQSNTVNGEFSYKKADAAWCVKLIEILASRDKKAWYTIRQLIADEQTDSFNTAFRFMFDNLEKFSFGNDAELSIILDDFIWRSTVVPDKEINMMACIAKVLETTRKKVI